LAIGGGNHVVRQGECVLSIAARRGFLRDRLWEKPGNAVLAEAGRRPYALLPGDKVDVPEVETKREPCRIETTNRFRLRSEPALLKLRLLDMGEPIAHAAYALEIDDKRIEGQSDGDGRITVEISADATQAVLRLEGGDRTRSFRLAVGAIDPIDAVSGAQGRLSNLGYGVGPIDGVMGPRTGAALRQFQKDNGLDVTGALDAATRGQLEAAYGG
jgi:hypothetical protein